MKIVIEKSFREVKGPVDTLVFQPIDYNGDCLHNHEFIEWVTAMAPKVRRMATVCIGTYIMAEAGLLHGRRATTHWAAQTDFCKRYRDITLDIDPIYVKDGKFYTSAGATSGLDMTLALIEDDFGKETALRVAQAMVMFLKRPGNQAQFSTQLAAQFEGNDRLRDVHLHITQTLDGDLGVETLAEQCNMSARNFSRVFRQQTGMAPGRYVELARLETARHWLENSDLPIAGIAQRCGFKSSDGMRALFDRKMGVTPRDYRQRFSTSDRMQIS
jgi:transcriptional regulator GlxA family with amidase domain